MNAAPSLHVIAVFDDVIAVSKPVGLHIHRLRDDDEPSLVDVVVAAFPDVGRVGDDPRECGLVHRLDVGTSGVVLFARTNDAHRTLRAQFSGDDVTKGYLAVVVGALREIETMDGPIAHHQKNRTRMVVVDGTKRHRSQPREAVTVAVPLAVRDDVSLVAVHMKGGRRHQIRVHLAHAGYPLVGDALYRAPATDLAAHPLLHAHTIVLPDERRFDGAPPTSFLDVTRALFADDAPSTFTDRFPFVG